MSGTFTCDNCGREFESRLLKEVMYEEGHERIRRELCPKCLDGVINESGAVRGIAGEKKRAAVHLDSESGTASGSGAASARQSFGERGSG
ncbi:MAG: hypothetical protein M3391_04355 [Actinomycetota bacterium]|nr:hypothetical protein [Actinomycetota bacterium]